MSQYWSPLVHRLTPYVPGEQPKLEQLVKLNTNENPYPPSPKAIEAIEAEIGRDGARLRLYPEPSGERLRLAVSRHFAEHAIAPEQVFVGNGSDEVLAHAFMALLKHEKPVLMPDISYSFYPVYCGLYEIESLAIALGERYQLEVDDYLAHAGKAGGIIIANPNAPTGGLVALADVEKLAAAHHDCVVVIDEAYIDFAASKIPSAITLVNRHPNVLVVRTLSKSHSLAGLRIGYAVGDRALIEALERVKNSFNSYPLDRLALAGASAALDDRAYFDATRGAVMRSREALVADLARLGFDVLPSAANFVFARHRERDAAELARALRERKVIVRHFALPRIDQHLRISIGNDEACAALVAALEDILR